MWLYNCHYEKPTIPILNERKRKTDEDLCITHIEEENCTFFIKSILCYISDTYLVTPSRQVLTEA